MNKFENWLKVRSSNKYSNYYKIVNYSEDNRLGFFIQYAINDIYSNIVRYTIKAAISCHGNIPDSDYSPGQAPVVPMMAFYQHSYTARALE